VKRSFATFSGGVGWGGGDTLAFPSEKWGESEDSKKKRRILDNLGAQPISRSSKKKKKGLSRKSLQRRGGALQLRKKGWCPGRHTLNGRPIPGGILRELCKGGGHDESGSPYHEEDKQKRKAKVGDMVEPKSVMGGPLRSMGNFL